MYICLQVCTIQQPNAYLIILSRQKVKLDFVATREMAFSLSGYTLPHLDFFQNLRNSDNELNLCHTKQFTFNEEDDMHANVNSCIQDWVNKV